MRERPPLGLPEGRRGMVDDVRWMMEDSLLFEKKQKVMFIFLAQEKGTKRTSTLTHPLPIWRGSNSELQKPTVLSAFWYRGTTRWFLTRLQAGPLMVRAYLSVRATGGAVFFPMRGENTRERWSPFKGEGDGGCSKRWKMEDG